jgi:hypothetical protein
LSRQVVEQNRGVRVKIGNVEFDTTKVLVGLQRGQVRSKLGAGRPVQRGGIQVRQGIDGQVPKLGQGLGRRDHCAGIEPVQRALGCRVKRTQAIHLVAKELNAHRSIRVHRKDINDPASTAECTRRLDDADHLVTQFEPYPEDLGHADPLPNLDRADAQREFAPR